MPRNLHRRKGRDFLPFLISLFAILACEDPQAKKAREAEARRAAIAAESERASGAAAVTTSAGAWTAALVTKRLVDAGLAPLRRDSARAEKWFGVPVHGLTLGVATVDAYIFADSASRIAATAKLDPVTLAPAGEPTPYGPLRGTVSNGNLFVVVVGGTDRQRERILTALAGGIGAP
jgi:hypothetical protein